MLWISLPPVFLSSALQITCSFRVKLVSAIQQPRPSGHLGLDQAITTVYGACVNAKNLTPLKARWGCDWLWISRGELIMFCWKCFTTPIFSGHLPRHWLVSTAALLRMKWTRNKALLPTSTLISSCLEVVFHSIILWLCHSCNLVIKWDHLIKQRRDRWTAGKTHTLTHI